MVQFHELKPNRKAFVNYNFLKSAVFSLPPVAVAAVTIAISLGAVFAGIFAAVYVLLLLWIYFVLTVRFKKEKYVFYRDRIVRKSGGVFSNRETELVIRNITHVKMKMPFIEYKLFGTGSINIQSAGSGGVEVRMYSIGHPAKFYEYVSRLMKANGFSLKKKSLVQRERPSTIGVFFEVFKSIFTFLIVIVYFFPTGGLAIVSAFGTQYIGVLIGLAVVVFIPVFVHFTLRFLDLKRRVYEIYSDTITYSEGFLSKNYAFIPVENLADSEVNQTLIDKIFGLYDVKISCQGAGSEILFKNMRNGPKLEKNIDALIGKFEPLIGKAKTAKAAASGVAKKEAPVSQKAMNPDYVAEFRMNMPRSIASPFLLLAVIVAFVVVSISILGIFAGAAGVIPAVAIAAFPTMIIIAVFTSVPIVIKVLATKYFVKKESVEQRYDFLSSRHKEFTNEKIMAVVFKENFIDKWFGTCSIHFWSIGSSESVKFSNIKKTAGLYGSILGKIGVKEAEPIYTRGSEFSFAEMLRANIFSTIFSIIFYAGLLVAGVFINYWFIIALIVLLVLYAPYLIYQYAYYKRSKLAFYRDFVHFRKGIFFKDFYYSPNNNIKGITTVRYPLSSKGSITFDVAGEQAMEIKAKHGRRTTHVVSNHFTINYMPDITTKDDFIDLMFDLRPTSAEAVARIAQRVSQEVSKPLIFSKPAVANTLFVSLLVFVPLLAFLAVLYFRLPSLVPFTIPFLTSIIAAVAVLALFFIVLVPVALVKVKSFSIESYRLVARSGIVYKKQKSILLKKVDHINLIQGMLNKMFSNGTIAVNTTGSSASEMVITDLPDFSNFYKELQKMY